MDGKLDAKKKDLSNKPLSLDYEIVHEVEGYKLYREDGTVYNTYHSIEELQDELIKIEIISIIMKKHVKIEVLIDNGAWCVI